MRKALLIIAALALAACTNPIAPDANAPEVSKGEYNCSSC